MSLGPTDPEQIIKFLIGSAPEPYPYAKVVALLTFCAWMRWPNDVELIESAQVTAAACVVVYEKANGNNVTIPLTIESLCEAIINDPLASNFEDAMLSATDPITNIVSFFMFCPEERKPSLLKARYFINAGGFVDDDIPKDEVKQYKKSEATLKVVWKQQAVAGPFLWAGHFFEEDPENLELLNIVPDEIESVAIARNFLADSVKIRRFLGIALFCQNKLSRLLDPSAAKVRFVKFPKSVQPIEPGIGTFDEKQLEILSKYRAPI
jgi:hypothetical protein